MKESIIIEAIKSITSIIIAIIAGGGVFIGVRKYSSSHSAKYIRNNLSMHPVFAKINLNKNIILTYFRLENKAKETVFREILVKHMDIYKKHINTLCQDIEREVNNENDLYSLSSKTINNIITDLREFYITSTEYNEDDKKVLKFIIEKYNNWDYDREIETVNRIHDVCFSQFYPDIYIKSVTILDTFLYSINDTVLEANKTLNSINGDLVGLSFKGVMF